jgi:hypothetical protein
VKNPTAQERTDMLPRIQAVVSGTTAGHLIAAIAWCRSSTRRPSTATLTGVPQANRAPLLRAVMAELLGRKEG